MGRRFATTIATTAALCAVLVAGCSSSDSGDNGSAQPEPLPWPLTGLPGYPEGAAAQAITVKIENTEAGRPQLGVGGADVVVQELVEGGLTRLAAIYNSQYPDVVGPVRSMRQTDIGIVLPTGGTLAASGGSGSTLAAVRDEGVPIAVEGDPGFSRDSTRPAPYNVMLNVSELSESLPEGAPPQPYFTFGAVPGDATAAPAATLALRWPSASSSFAFDAASGRWVRSDVADATGFDFTNVIALSVPVTFGGGTDASGTSVPTMVTTGSGSGYVATGGAVYEVAWSKDSLSAPWQFTYQSAAEGAEPAAFTVPAGRTWLGLLPEQGGSVAFEPPAAVQ